MGRRISDPMSTRRDQRLIEAAIREAIKRGFVKVIPSDDGVDRYQITELGSEYFERVLAGEEEE
jgi:DNA-binding PadR family transcriptional regulator